MKYASIKIFSQLLNQFHSELSWLPYYWHIPQPQPALPSFQLTVLSLKRGRFGEKSRSGFTFLHLSGKGRESGECVSACVVL